MSTILMSQCWPLAGMSPAQIMALPVRERDFMADQLDVFEYVGCLGSNRRGE